MAGSRSCHFSHRRTLRTGVSAGPSLDSVTTPRPNLDFTGGQGTLDRPVDGTGL